MEEKERKQYRLSGFQAVVRDRLYDCYSKNVHTSMFLTVNMQGVLRKKKSLEEKNSGKKYSFYVFILRAAALALRDNPMLNNHYQDGMVSENERINIGIALDVQGKLMVPNIKNCEELSLDEINERVGDLMARAQSGKIKICEMQGGTFTVNNLGSLGIDYFTAIVNPPEVAILNIGQTKERLAMQGEDIVSVPETVFGLSINHSYINGSHGAAFLNAVKNYLEKAESAL